MTDLANTALQLRSLTIFRGLLKGDVIRAFLAMTDVMTAKDTGQSVSQYAAFAEKLYAFTPDFGDYVLSAALNDENVYLLKYVRGEKIDACIRQSLQNELDILEKFSMITSSDIQKQIGYDGFLAAWTNTPHDFTASYQRYLENIHTNGYGIFARHHIFTIEDHALVPVLHPDETSLSQLNGYEYERKSVVDNTLALLDGKPAANVLLYGDSGTGKSSTVKAVANEFASRGLRLIEIKKNQLRDIPALMDSLGKNPLKFILFIDDLSFTKDDDDFGALKAILEGSVSARTKNLAVYATSNRRHLVRESFSDREGDEVHANDTVQQLTSLSDRFGLTITFWRPNRAQYLAIVGHLATYYDVDVSRDELFRQAEIYALERGGRSPRVAKQFLEYVQSVGLD
ncbi:MAG: ATP-binding protein [Christensenella sp.]|uniref:ATP-binding protein n=1 Tax=Christensenella sp. TaxID=1935934 RepID=UPI002B1E9D25|nr:ATP-binding protein [Christensenella sp.]MEA5004455.1 ATP-binding protein [Christensenella sp.]